MGCFSFIARIWLSSTKPTFRSNILPNVRSKLHMLSQRQHCSSGGRPPLLSYFCLPATKLAKFWLFPKHSLHTATDFVNFEQQGLGSQECYQCKLIWACIIQLVMTQICLFSWIISILVSIKIMIMGIMGRQTMPKK